MAQVERRVKQDEGVVPKQQARENAPAHLQRVVYWLSQRWFLSLMLFAAALVFNLHKLGTPGIWFDEAFSVELARQPLPLLWHIIFGLEPNMELYYLFLHFWLALTGAFGLHATEFVVRFPSAIFAALCTVVVFWLGQRFLSTMAGLVGASLYLLNMLQLTYAQQTRSYSLQLLLTCIAWYALLSALTCTTRSRRWWIVYSVATVLAIYAHLFSVLILLAQLVAVALLLVLPTAWRPQTRKHLLSLVISLLVTGILNIPMLLVSLQGAKTGWIPIPHWHDLLALFQFISGYSQRNVLAIAFFSIAGCVVVTLAYALRYLSKRNAEQEEATLAALFPITVALFCWLVVPIGVSYVVSHGSIRLFSSRYLVTIVPPLMLLIGLGVEVIRWLIPGNSKYRSSIAALLQGGLALVLVFLSFSTVSLYYGSAQVEDWNSVSHWTIDRYQAGDGLVCYDNDVQQGCQISVEYYLHAYPSAAHFTDDSPGAFSWQNFGPVDASAGPDAATDPQALAAYGAKHARIFFIVGRLPDDAAATKAVQAQHWLDSHYTLVGQFLMRTVTVRLYATR